jgi:hypothetical protein
MSTTLRLDGGPAPTNREAPINLDTPILRDATATREPPAARDAPAATETPVNQAANDPAGGPAPWQPPVAPPGPNAFRPANCQYETLLENAVYLLRYAIEAGITVDAELAQRIIAAERRGKAAWEDASAGTLAADITKLATLVHPVTADTLWACREQAHDTMRGYKRIAVWLAAFIIPLSMISFMYTGISNCITADLTTANQLATSLHTQLGTIPPTAPGAAPQIPPPSSLPDLQQFAATIRSVHNRTQQLAWFVPYLVKDTVPADSTFELPPDLANQWDRMLDTLNHLTATYQQVRSYARAVEDSASVVYGAISSCILPVLYGLLGACAYLLRIFSDQIATRTFLPTYATPARFVIAAIGGAIVGLFNNFTVGQGVSLSPLAIAFLVGYAADIFFSFIEGSVQNFKKPKST